MKGAAYDARRPRNRRGEGRETDHRTKRLRVLAVRELLDRPQAISTSRHLTQGLLDLSDETWDPASSTLTGTSQVVSGDAYELQILTRCTVGRGSAGDGGNLGRGPSAQRDR